MNVKDLLTGNITAKAHRKIMVLLLATLPGFIPFAASTFADDLQTAENILLYQRETGGWPKNYDRQQELTEAQRQDVLNNKSKNDSMIDNGATHTEICLLADAFQKTQDDRFKQAALRGIRYLLDGQYDNGGWPQQFPGPRGYAFRKRLPTSCNVLTSSGWIEPSGSGPVFSSRFAPILLARSSISITWSTDLWPLSSLRS